MGTMIRTTQDQGFQKATPTRSTSPAVLVATNGCGGSDGAVSIAAQLLERSHARVTVIGVVDPGAIARSEHTSESPCAAQAFAHSELLERVLVQLARVSPACVDWAVEVTEGDPAVVLARLGSQRNARLIITGLGHHDAEQDRFGAETTLRILGAAKVPLLAVPESFERLPERAIVATDFSEYSLNAAREALALFPSLTDVDFVHVAPATSIDMEAIHRWLTPSGRDPASLLDDVRRRIGAYAGVTYKTTALRGESAQEILRHARATGADIIVAGSRGAGLAQRIIVGSTATQLLREAECAVLAVPVPTTRPWARLAELSGKTPPA
jgi:nucleotide-binding universal stress UspA family protein